MLNLETSQDPWMTLNILIEADASLPHGSDREGQRRFQKE